MPAHEEAVARKKREDAWRARMRDHGSPLPLVDDDDVSERDLFEQREFWAQEVANLDGTLDRMEIDLQKLQDNIANRTKNRRTAAFAFEKLGEELATNLQKSYEERP